MAKETTTSGFVGSITRTEAEVMVRRPYEHPAVAYDGDRLRANKLVRLGLMEKCVYASGSKSKLVLFRCTARGSDVVNRLRQLGWLPWKR